jgi:UDP-GlcNAc:undecaprenyl-phosphate/decaprenyl-phosphate GlcNAc-1-phosphate transferase
MAGLILLTWVLALGFSAWVMLCGPIDRPQQRRVHVKATTTSGGLAVLGTTCFGVGLWALLGAHLRPDTPTLWAFAFALFMGLSGGVDDILGLSPRLRLGLQVVAALIFAAFFPDTQLALAFGLSMDIFWPLAVLGTGLWIVVGLNVVNFMDGSNGLAAGCQTLALAALSFVAAGAPQTQTASVIFGLAAVATLCFLPFNLPFSRLFQGDAGALFGAGLITSGLVILTRAGVVSIWFGGFLLAPLLVDVILTLILRTAKGEKLFTAHKQHLFQQWLIHSDPNHGRLALKVWALSLMSILIGLGLEACDRILGLDFKLGGLLLLIGLLSGGWVLARRSLGALKPDCD